MSTSVMSPKSLQALEKIKTAGKIEALKGLVDILIDPTKATGTDQKSSNWRDVLRRDFGNDFALITAMDKFINEGKNAVPPPDKYNVDLSSYGIVGKDLMSYVETDQTSVNTINNCISSWLYNVQNTTHKPGDIDLYIDAANLPSTTTPSQARFHFWQNKITSPDLVIHTTFLTAVSSRLAKFISGGENLENLPNDEDKETSEDIAILSGQLRDVFENMFGLDYDGLVSRTFMMRNVNSFNVQANKFIVSFERVFSRLDLGALETLAVESESNYSFSALIDKMEAIGVFALASYALEISDYAKKRFENKFQTEKSAADLVNPSVDLKWIIILGEVKDRLKKDPLAFAAINYYFPSFSTFFIGALAAVGDYSNNGKGGGEEDQLNDPEKLLDSLAKAFGVNANGEAIFTLAYEISNTAKRIKEVIEVSPFRPNVTPKNPDIFHLRLGAANFYVPPITIDVNTSFKTGSLTGAAIRQKNSPKFNSGYKETSIRLRLFFPNYEEIWGISIDDASSINLNEDFKIDFKNSGDSEFKIDKFLSSLRGLIAAFKYSPFLPVKNDYLNRVHGITAVALNSMNISTIPNFPFAVAVDIELLNFNHEPFLPMIKDFNQAIHWGKYRQYMGKAAGYMHSYVNEEFLLKTLDSKQADTSSTEVLPGVKWGSAGNEIPEYVEKPVERYGSFKDDVLKTNVIKEWRNGNHITLFTPAETQTKIFLPDTSSFRSEQEKIMPDLSENLWQNLLAKIGIDINQSASYGIPLSQTIEASRETTYSVPTRKIIEYSLDILTAGINPESSTEKLYQFMIESFIAENSSNNILNSENKAWLRNYNTSDPGGQSSTAKSDWKFQRLFINDVSLAQMKARFKDIAANPNILLDFIVEGRLLEKANRTNSTPDSEKERQEVARAFSVTVYDRFFKSGPIQSFMEASRLKAGNYQFNEWEVPMLRVDLDPKHVIINGISVSLRNSFAKMQVQMQDEPTYQHIGGGDSIINISMTIFQEKELIKLKNIFSHISGLARLEHSTGVIGFLGIKNVLTALSGIKYVLPLNYSVNTRPNYPHVYDVQLSLVDFDIMQQKREKISSEQQRELVEHFQTKRNPFLRIKQLWGTFNAYPDFPLDIKDAKGHTVGHLDPDFYFRSFEMFDRDVVNSFSSQEERIQNFSFSDSNSGGATIADVGKYGEITKKILDFFRLYSSAGSPDSVQVGDVGYIEKQKVLEQMKEYMATQEISKEEFLRILQLVSSLETSYDYSLKVQLLTDFMEVITSPDELDPFFAEINPAPFKQGDISPNQMSQIVSIQAALEGKYNLPEEENVSFHPDEVDFHRQVFLVPALNREDLLSNKQNAFIQTAVGNHFGYIDKITGRFYLTVAGYNVNKTSNDSKYKFNPNFIKDTQIPEVGNTNSNTGVSGVVALSAYQKSYDGDVYKHWEKMMVDTSYRDISGRMLRAFPSYMLWLIDEGGYFAGVKLFDNFYGLQSIIDFSVVSSEDLLGDTLVLRLSNLYNKLTTPDSATIFNPNLDEFNEENLTLEQGLSGLVNRALNFSRNFLSGTRNEYIVDINNIRLKPGVRVHLRAGYGSNPNSLQTLFNGIITNVEPGEIITVTAQSDAIELGAVINSTNKKGDSGKIDGGIDTGMYLSEPRDLMVRLLSMGSSRSREALARATRGTIFSENRFGIRHFGMILYEPLTQGEKDKSDAIRDSVASAFTIAGSNNSIPSKIVDITEGFTMNYRGNTLTAMGQLFSNFSAQTDLEIFKRNIYPGNGTGIAQFLGGDLDDGWSTAASLVPQDSYNERLDGYLGRLTDFSWNKLLQQSESGSVSASQAIEDLTTMNRLQQSEGRESLVKGSVGIALTALATVVNPVGGVVTGLGLTGILRGRGGTNFFRLLGLISPNSDDDLSGFDEVSFRAQTYMRTVWDLFQTCARLLPNYIVAVRPFEDRSTVFYGKPHWLYTSGVVPVTTGFPGVEKAQELGIPIPQIREPDADLTAILDRINRNTNPYADYSAFFSAGEVNPSISQSAELMLSSKGIYSPTSYLSGKLISFNSEPARTYTEPIDSINNRRVVAMIPKTVAKVYIGPHLPIGINDSRITKDTIENQRGIPHLQFVNLPPRFQFPYFATTEQTPIEGSSTVVQNYVEGIVDLLDDKNIELTGKNLLPYLTKVELDFFEQTKQTLMPSEGAEGVEGTILLDRPLDFAGLRNDIQGIDFAQTYIKMPFPNFGSAGLGDVDASGIFEYSTDVFGKLTYNEWGSPDTPEHEQFYIAMKWPYNPPDDSVKEAFKEEYGFLDLYGTAQDYKNRKVLVYNPSNNRAVVCKPAYFMWGENADLFDATVSPEAAYFLGIITDIPPPPEEDKPWWKDALGAVDAAWDATLGAAVAKVDDVLDWAIEKGGTTIAKWVQDQLDDSDKNFYTEFTSGFRLFPTPQQCFIGFVPDNVPVGVVSPSASSAPTPFKMGDSDLVIGFGKFNPEDGSVNEARVRDFPEGTIGSPDSLERRVGILPYNNSLNYVQPVASDYISSLDNLKYGGNPIKTANDQSYFQAVIKEGYEELTRDSLYAILDGELASTGDSDTASGRFSFAPIYDPADLISIEARSFYDENYDPAVSVIAGDGRTLKQGQDIWDQFRFGYHTYESVKRIFFDTFGLDADSEVEFPPFYKNIISNTSNTDDGLLDYFKEGVQQGTAIDEFAVLLGSEYINQLSTTTRGSRLDFSYTSRDTFEEAIEFARSNYIDAPLEDGGLVEYFNTIILKSLKSIHENFLSETVVNNILEFSLDAENQKAKSQLGQYIKTPKQLFLFIVGVFRQRMWEDPYARAWLVLKPDRKKTGDDQWSFRPVDKIFRAFIDPYNDFAKPSKKEKFLKLLISTRGEGNSDTNIVSEATTAIGDFWNATVGPIFTAIGDGLNGLLAAFKLSMQQMGYALSEIGNFKKQANILNKALNDSIYYSLGRPGTILRAVDNPFTREYGEPVVEIREPFQRMHYISSFSHILSNRIQENLNNVATVVTAVSDGKYPVTVALDKGAPAERQTEKTVETGIYFDNMVGSGFLGVLHPFLHPLETFRGAAKNVQGAPDELSARRIALAHLKESIKDIYTGEVIVIGNGDIRPHDLVYIADVYERMYGIFEVEQVVHHFTPDLGYITSITPNAMVTVNDPARWFMTSWMHSWFNVQVVRNDTRVYLDRIRAGNAGITVGGNVSVDALAEALSSQMIGGIQFTHGSSALVKDIMANQTAQDLEMGSKGLIAQAGASAGGTGGLSQLVMAGLAQSVPIVGQLAWKGWKWVRDNLLDQHGCYVQYLNKNGQPMDAGLSYNQGMVVGQHHTKNLLPGILGVRQKVRTTEGYSYIRSDDLFKSLGWNEVEIQNLVRYISYETALVHGRVLQLSGLGPEKAGLERQFRVICRLDKVLDGDTIVAEDVISGAKFTVRFDAINTGETNTIEGRVNWPSSTSETNLSILDISTPGGAAKIFVEKALTNKLFIVRVNPTREKSVSVLDEDFEAGSNVNTAEYYTKDVFDRTLGTIWYYLPEKNIEPHKSFINNLFRESSNNFNEIKVKIKDSLYTKSPFRIKFDEIYSKINDTINSEQNSFILNSFYDKDNYSTNDPLYNLDSDSIIRYNNLVYMKVLEEIYDISSQWPQTAWDEYHSDGTAYTLNWELVLNNLAKVYIKDIQTESSSVQTSADMVPGN